MTRKEEINKEANNFANTVSIGEQEIDKTWSAFISGAEWADRTMIDKVCEWLKLYRQDTYDGTGYIAGIVNDKTIEDLRKAMEGTSPYYVPKSGIPLP